MRFIALSLLVLASGCAPHRVSLEGLRPRAAEAIDPRLPIPSKPVAGAPSAALPDRVAALERRADQGAAAFAALLPQANAAAARAGANGSESWIEAQQLISALVGARGPVTLALGDLDELAAETVAARGDLSVADRALVSAAAARVAAIDAEQAATVDRVRARTAR